MSKNNLKSNFKSYNNILLHLSLINKVGPATIEKLVQAFLSKSEDLFSNIYNMTKKDLVNYGKVTELLAETIVNGLTDHKLLDQELNLIYKNGIKFITVLDSDYPKLLKSIYLPPTILYIKSSSSDFSLDFNILKSRSVSIVGSRKPDNYGLSVVNSLVPELVNADFTIVSGGAYGIDTAAHKATVLSQGKTIAVLGSGLLKPYPYVNSSLFEKIADGYGAVVSPFSLNTTPLPGNFPARNRVISGISLGCTVIQAAQKSGALITAQYSLNEGREVFAVPGPINNDLSFGPHKLVSEGATLVTSSQDILNSLVSDRDHNLRISVNSDLNKLEHKAENKKINSEELGFKDNKNNKKNYIEFTQEEKILFHCSQPISFDDLLTKVNIDFQELQNTLGDLQIAGTITQNFMGFWEKTR